MAVLNISVKSLQVIKCGPALASATISILKQLSRYNSHIGGIYGSRTHHIITINTNHKVTRSNIRSHKNFKSIKCTSKINYVMNSSFPAILSISLWSSDYIIFQITSTIIWNHRTSILLRIYSTHLFA